ncbi:MAG: TCP-1/cpn60 chaperonin family protein, partial [Candidatus Bathyarchaeia archaeon]
EGFDLNAIRITNVEGGSLEESRLVDGFAVRREPADESMPRMVSNASILVLKGEIRDKKRGYTDYEHTISIEDPAEIEAVRENRVNRLRGTVRRIREAGANVVILEQGIDPLAAKMLSDAGILVVRRFTIEDLERIAQATGGQIVYDVNDVSDKALGYARLVEVRKHHGHDWMFIEGCRNPRSLTLLLKGLSERSLNKWERKVRCALTVLNMVFKNPKVVFAGGAADLEVSRMLHVEAREAEPLRRIIIQRFADSIIRPVEALIKNAGLDPLTILPTMKAKHRSGEKHVGFDALEGKIVDMSALRVYDLLAVKEFAISSAVEAACMILRIDDYVKARALEGKAKAEKMIEVSRSREYRKKLYREHRLETAEP